MWAVVVPPHLGKRLKLVTGLNTVCVFHNYPLLLKQTLRMRQTKQFVFKTTTNKKKYYFFLQDKKCKTAVHIYPSLFFLQKSKFFRLFLFCPDCCLTSFTCSGQVPDPGGREPGNTWPHPFPPSPPPHPPPHLARMAELIAVLSNGFKSHTLSLARRGGGGEQYSQPFPLNFHHSLFLPFR